MAGVLQEADKAKKLEEKAKKEAEKGPKRGLSAYMYYTADVRAKFKEENPDAKLGDLAKLIGAKWKTLSDEDKVPYEEKAKEDKARYEKEKKEWEANKKKDKEKAAVAAKAAAEAEAEATKEAAQKAVADKHSKALELAAKLNGGDSSWFVKVLADAKQIEAMPAVRCRSQALAFPLPKKPASGGAERAAWCAGCARRERRGRLLQRPSDLRQWNARERDRRHVRDDEQRGVRRGLHAGCGRLQGHHRAQRRGRRGNG